MHLHTIINHFLCILKLENFNVSSICDEKIIINGQEEDERQEEGGGREEVPHVVVVIEIHKLAWCIPVPVIHILIYSYAKQQYNTV